MEVTVEGITTDVIAWHHENAKSPIDVTSLENVIVQGLTMHRLQHPKPLSQVTTKSIRLDGSEEDPFDLEG